MGLKIEAPYSKKYDKIYEYSSNGRTYVTLYRSGTKDRESMSKARYVMSVSLGRVLKKNEHVDHKDDDKTNDRLSNLQIMSQAENNVKLGEQKGGRMYALLKCPICRTTNWVPDNKLSVRKSSACSPSHGTQALKLESSERMLIVKRKKLTQKQRTAMGARE